MTAHPTIIAAAKLLKEKWLKVHLSVWLTCHHRLKNQPLFLLVIQLRKAKRFLSLKL